MNTCSDGTYCYNVCNISAGGVNSVCMPSRMWGYEDNKPILINNGGSYNETTIATSSISIPSPCSWLNIPASVRCIKKL